MKRITIAVVAATIVGAAAVGAQAPTPPAPPAPPVSWTPATPAVAPVPALAPLADLPVWEEEIDPLALDMELDDDVLAYTPEAPRAERVMMHRGHGFRGMRHRAHRMGMLAADLDLTEAQRTKMRDIADRQQRQAIKTKADLDIARMDLRALTREDNADVAKINAQIDRMARMRADLEKSRVGSRIEMRSVLTPEQKQKLKEARSSGSRKMRAPTPPTQGEGGDT